MLASLSHLRQLIKLCCLRGAPGGQEVLQPFQTLCRGEQPLLRKRSTCIVALLQMWQCWAVSLGGACTAFNHAPSMHLPTASLRNCIFGESSWAPLQARLHIGCRGISGCFDTVTDGYSVVCSQKAFHVWPGLCNHHVSMMHCAQQCLEVAIHMST